MPTSLTRRPHFFFVSGSRSRNASAICHTPSAARPSTITQSTTVPNGTREICSIAPPWSASPPPEPTATEMAIAPMMMCTRPSTT